MAIFPCVAWEKLHVAGGAFWLRQSAHALGTRWGDFVFSKGDWDPNTCSSAGLSLNSGFNSIFFDRLPSGKWVALALKARNLLIGGSRRFQYFLSDC